MPVEPDDRRRWDAQVSALRAAENDDEGTSTWRESVEAAANVRRGAKGRPPLAEWWQEKGEIEFHRLARAKGLLGSVR